MGHAPYKPQTSDNRLSTAVQPIVLSAQSGLSELTAGRGGRPREEHDCAVRGVERERERPKRERRVRRVRNEVMSSGSPRHQ